MKKGGSWSKETKIRISNSMRGNKNNEHLREPNQDEYRSYVSGRVWKYTIRPAVLERDNFTCVVCGLKGKCECCGHIKLEVNHIVPFSVNPKLVFELSNLETLCRKCHNKKTIAARAERVKNSAQQPTH